MTYTARSRHIPPSIACREVFYGYKTLLLRQDRTTSVTLDHGFIVALLSRQERRLDGITFTIQTAGGTDPSKNVGERTSSEGSTKNVFVHDWFS